MGKAEHTTGVKGAKAVDRQAAQAASDSPLTIALVVDTAGNEGNGTSNSALQYARELCRQGHVVRLVGIGSPEYPVAQRHVPLVSWIAAKQQMQFAQPDTEVFRKAFQGADVVHVYLPFAYGRAAVRTAHEMGIPATAGFHLQPENVLYSAGPLRYVPGASAFLYWLFNRMLYRHIRHIHTPSHMIAAQLRAHGYRQRLHVISNGYAPRFIPKQQREPGSPSPRPFMIVASGRLASEKDHATLIRAVALSRHAKDIELLICGTGPLQRELRHMAAELLPGRWSIGFHDNAQMPALLRSCDLLVHPSIVDIESLSVLEGMASGLVPVIAKSAQSAAGQFALTDRSLFDARDPVMLAQRIDWWIEHPDELSHWGAVYAEHTRQEYSIESCVHKFVAMEREAIADFDGVL
ncbi:glycosyltransferase [Pseudoscardovia suis]|uniref:glycosyltransferase n=1 Tax=Pseudoscardovia suis TaxID=987063 RepID=UPI003F975E70